MRDSLLTEILSHRPQEYTTEKEGGREGGNPARPQAAGEAGFCFGRCLCLRLKNDDVRSSLSPRLLL